LKTLFAGLLKSCREEYYCGFTIVPDIKALDFVFRSAGMPSIARQRPVSRSRSMTDAWKGIDLMFGRDLQIIAALNAE
jgi:hypothetical protein